MMSNSCQVCESRANLWQIYSGPRALPQVQPFTICHNHLQSKKFSEIHQALGLGRFNQQREARVEHGNWILDKLVSTWENDKKMECSMCNKSTKLWTEIYWHSDPDPNDYFDRGGWHMRKVICDSHLLRKNYEAKITFYDPQIHREGEAEVGIRPIEETWNTKDQGRKKTETRIINID